MSFNYDDISHKESEHASWWTSYADLFMMLSIVFLLMYVASSLRSGSAGFQQQVAYKQLEKRAADLEEQIKVYNTLKDETLRKQSTEQEQEVYQKLMGKLDLLQEEAHNDNLALKQKAKENEEKEFALNQYQQLIRNIINTNILAKSQISHRDLMIVSKDATIEEKKQRISELETTVTQNESQITTINAQLNDRIEALRNEQHRSKTSKVALERRIEKLRKESEDQVHNLVATNETITAQLGQVRGTLEQSEQEKGALKSQLEKDKTKYTAELDSLKQQHQNQLAAERAAFNENLKHQKLSEAARAEKMANFLKSEKKKASQLEGQLSGLQSKIQETEGQLKGKQTELQGTQNKLAGVEAEKGRALAEVQGLQGDLARTREIANARKKLAQQLSDQFAKSGIKGAVDPRTGEVTLDFGEEFFDTGSTSLKPKMRSTLDKFIPIYAKSLFADPKIAGKIASVEVVGFASSTYRGRYINPKSVNAEDKDAIDYNLKLSFGRANSIFKHVLNERHISTEDRDRLLPLMKVVGRGYLPEGVNPNELPAGMDENKFCAQYNCKKAQKVIVKFNMKD